MEEIRRLTAPDLPEYFQHIERVYSRKGVLSVDDKTWVRDQEQDILNSEALLAVLRKGATSLWAVIVDGKIERSIRAEMCAYPPSVRLINYKSEAERPFNPIKDLLPLLEEVFKYFEAKQVYVFYLLRRLDFFANRRLKFFEDNPPLNRYNCYFEDVILAGTESKHQTWRDLAGNKVYPVDMGVACMCLKQQYRVYQQEIKIMPDTIEYSFSFNRKAPTCVSIIGSNLNRKDRLGYYLHHSAINSEWNLHQVRSIGREDIDFEAEGWRGKLDDMLKTDDSHVIILNLFDRRPGKGYIQEMIFIHLWDTYKYNPHVQIVVIGSLSHYYPSLTGVPQEYQSAKASLKKVVTNCTQHIHAQARLLFVELGVLESMLEQKPAWSARFFKNKEAARAIVDLAIVNKKIMCVGLTGPHLWSHLAENTV